MHPTSSTTKEGVLTRVHDPFPGYFCIVQRQTTQSEEAPVQTMVSEGLVSFLGGPHLVRAAGAAGRGCHWTHAKGSAIT
jgi:hypothetical protein